MMAKNYIFVSDYQKEALTNGYLNFLKPVKKYHKKNKTF